MATPRSTVAGRAGYYTTAAALAILFLFPLVWSGWSSVRGQPGSSQASGYGFGNTATWPPTARGCGPTWSTPRR